VNKNLLRSSIVVLHLQGISKQFGSKVLFEKAEAHIGHRSRVALIGPNGAGKSTLIRIILGKEHPDSGEIIRAKHLSIGYLAQEVPKFSGSTVLEEVMRLDGRREEILKTKKELEEILSKTTQDQGAEHADHLERYGRILEELEHLDEYRLEARAKEILTGMGFKPADYHRSLTELSGGWLMRVALSRVLLSDPDLLLLDEPTNHLDLESLLWLEEFLGGYQGALLLVSHDTAFLNRMVTEVCEIDQKQLWTYKGNLDSYSTQKSERLAVLRAQYEGQQAKIAEIEAFVSRFGAKATKARQAQSRLKQLEKMERIELPEDRAGVRFRFPPAPHSGKEVITMSHAALSFNQGQKKIFDDLNWVLRRGSRVAIVGVNGAGKTTLLKLLSGQLDPSAGDIRLGHMVKVGYYAQHQAESLNMQNTILQELEQTVPEMPVAQVRAIAGAFLFSGDAVDKKCAVLSGGEKARVALAKLLLSPSNFLILDEPTNHLDVESRGVLLDALSDYEGTLCLVSHDRDFISPLVDSVLEINPSPQGSTVTPLLGSYDDYLQRKIREIAEAKTLATKPAAATATSAQPAPKRTGPSNNQKVKWAKEKEDLEKEISRLEVRQAELHEILADVKTYEDKAKSMALADEQRQLEATLMTKLNRWEEISVLLEEN
jgi:ATP-binding cassette subfamily F protein 3